MAQAVSVVPWLVFKVAFVSLRRRLSSEQHAPPFVAAISPLLLMTGVCPGAPPRSYARPTEDRYQSPPILSVHFIVRLVNEKRGGATGHMSYTTKVRVASGLPTLEEP